jgi:hypothetical protein
MLLNELEAPSSNAAQDASDTPVAFVAGPWRIMVWQVAIGPAFPEQGLEARSGSNWAILIADVTNVGLGGELAVNDIALGLDEISGDPARSVSASKSLGLTAISDRGILSIEENSMARVAVVMDLLEKSVQPYVTLDGELTAIDSVLVNSLDLDQLPQARTKMQLETANVVSVSRTPQLDVMLDNGDEEVVALVGLNVPVDCFKDESQEILLEATSGGLWLETITGTTQVTVWTNDSANGVFVLLDQALIDAGAVYVGSASPERSIYGSWLVSRATEAAASGVGGFSQCDWSLPRTPQSAALPLQVTPTPSARPTPRPVPTPMPTARSNANESAQDDTLAVFNDPYAYVGDTVVVSGQVFIIGTQEGDTYMVVTDYINGTLIAFAVAYPGYLSGVSEGDSVTVYGVVVGVENLEGDNLPLILASEIVER